MAREISFDMVPDISLMEKIGATSFTLAEAIVELVANSIDARPEKAKLDVAVDVGDNRVVIVDNGVGMTDKVLREAVRLGVNMDDFVRRDGRKGMYGLGMKTACASLGRHWSVTTRPIDSDKEYYVEFDLQEIRKRAAAAKPWQHRMEERKRDPRGVLGNRNHGTAILVTRLRDSHPMSGAVVDALGKAYGPHILAGDVIKVNGSPAPPPTYALMGNTKINIDEPCGVGGKWRVTGWAGLDNKTHNDGFYGLNLYRKGQLIEAWNKDFFRAHLMTSRIIGDLNLDFVPPNFHKKGFENQSPEWKTAQEHMWEFLKPLVKASETASQGKKDATRFVRASQGIKNAYGAMAEIGTLLLPEPDVETGSNGDGATIGTDDEAPIQAQKGIVVDANTIHLPDGPITVCHKVEEIEADADMPWDYIYDPKARELQAILNADSHLFKVVKDQNFLGILALSECVTQFLVEERQMPPADAKRIRNKWLSAALGRK